MINILHFLIISFIDLPNLSCWMNEWCIHMINPIFNLKIEINISDKIKCFGILHKVILLDYIIDPFEK